MIKGISDARGVLGLGGEPACRWSPGGTHFSATQLPKYRTGAAVFQAKDIKAIDFCCGAGGLSRGLLEAGISVVAGVDNDERLRRTYERNNKPSRFIATDLAEVDVDALCAELGVGASDITLYAACTPCQPFSTLNTAKGDDARKSLLLEFGKIIARRPPDFVIVENVPGLHNAFGLDIYREFIAVLERQGFGFDSGLLDAKDYGVPQTRKRFILVAAKDREPRLPPPTTKNSPVTVRDCIEKYPPLQAGEHDETFANHAARKLPLHHQRIVAAVPTDGGSRADVADPSILLPCHQRHPKAHKDVFGRMAWDAPSPTLTCRCTDIYCGRFIHPEQDRGISLREAAALQTFDDGYEFYGDSFLEQARQIGNAVPVRLARALGTVAIECLEQAYG